MGTLPATHDAPAAPSNPSYDNKVSRWDTKTGYPTSWPFYLFLLDDVPFILLWRWAYILGAQPNVHLHWRKAVQEEFNLLNKNGDWLQVCSQIKPNVDSTVCYKSHLYGWNQETLATGGEKKKTACVQYEKLLKRV